MLLVGCEVLNSKLHLEEFPVPVGPFLATGGGYRRLGVKDRVGVKVMKA